MTATVTSTLRRVVQLLLVLAAASSAPAWAATFSLNSTLDVVDSKPGDGVCETALGNGVCTLRAAIQESNKLVGTDIIQIPAGTYVIAIPSTLAGDSTGNLDITDSVNIVGAGAQVTIIDGGALDNVFASVGSSKAVEISGVTIQNGSVPATRLGGGIFARSSNSLTLTDVVVRNNHGGEGGGIYNQGNLILVRSVVEGNTAVRIVPGSIEFRRGGGIFHSFGSLTIRDSTIRENSAVSGGGVFNMGVATIETSTISGNFAINNDPLLNDGDAGGGIVNGGAIAGTMALTNSTISGNRSNGNYGGLYVANGTVTLSNATIADNVADADNDGFGNGGGLGLSFVNSAATVLRNTIVADNRAAGNAQDCMSLLAAALSSGGYNLLGNAGTANDCAFTPAAGDQIGTTSGPIAVGLKPLANYGGPTSTRALMDLSPAIDAGDPNGCTDGTNVLTIDQRGMPRASAGGSGAVRCDIGAYELLAPVANAGADQRVNANAAVVLDGSASTASGGIAAYSWTQLAGTAVSLVAANTASPSFIAPTSAGVLRFQLSVADGFETTASDTVDVVVNAAPIADAGADQTVGAGASVSLNGSASTDPDGSVVGYVWTQTGGTPVALGNANTVTPSFSAPASADTLVFQLTVTDNDGVSASDGVSITVSVPVPTPSTNIPPVAQASADQNVRPHAVVFLNGWKSYDPDGRIVSYQWTQTGGPTVKLYGAGWPWAGFRAPHDDGSLTFQLTVTDNKGATSTDSVTITVDDCTKSWYHHYFKKPKHRHGHECR